MAGSRTPLRLRSASQLLSSTLAKGINWLKLGFQQQSLCRISDTGTSSPPASAGADASQASEGATATAEKLLRALQKKLRQCEVLQVWPNALRALCHAWCDLQGIFEYLMAVESLYCLVIFSK